MNRMNTELLQEIDQEVVSLSGIKKRKPNSISISVRRKTGKELHIRLTGENARNTNWYIGKKYCLTNIELHRRDTGKFLLATHKTNVRSIDGSLLKMLVFGDTHIGYCRRNRENQNPEYKPRGEFKSLDEITSYYSGLENTLLFHTGDLFDHNAREEDLNYARECIEATEIMDEFRFIVGNHDQKASQIVTEAKLLEKVTCPDRFERLKISGYNIIMANTDALKKLDDFDWKEFERRYGGPNILISHPSHRDVEQRRTKLKSLSEIIEKRWVLFLGHHHRPRKYDFDGLTVVFTGSHIYDQDQNPVWRFEGGQEYHQVTGYDISSKN